MTSPISGNLHGVHEELDRVLCSRAFRDRDTLQQLLKYLVQRTLDGSADNLKEYVIGVDVFGKPSGYDPQSDASVRVQIGRLRRKLEEYYLDEGVSDPVVLQLPKRHFAISLEHRVFEPKLEREVSIATLPPPRGIRGLWLLHGAVTLVLAGLVLFLTIRTPGRSARVSPELSEIWKPFATGARPALMSLGTLQFYEYSTGMVREPDLDRLSNAERQPRLQELQNMLHSQPLKPYLLYTGVGQATAAFLLAKQFDRMNVPIDLVRSNVLGWEDIAQHNVIFIGSAKLNSQLREIPVNWAFRVESGRILNLQPKPGEASTYGSDYSLISLFPGLHGQGEIMVVESGSSTGVWAAARFLTDAGYAKELVGHLRQADGSLPRHYQVVLKSQIAADVPIRISYVTNRRL